MFLGLPFSGDMINVINGIVDVIKEKILMVIDEFQYVVSANPTFISRLQRLIDLKLTNRKLMIILCGSAVSFFGKSCWDIKVLSSVGEKHH